MLVNRAIQNFLFTPQTLLCLANLEANYGIIFCLYNVKVYTGGSKNTYKFIGIIPPNPPTSFLDIFANFELNCVTPRAIFDFEFVEIFEKFYPPPPTFLLLNSLLK